MAQAAESNIVTINFENVKIPEFKQVRGKDWIYFGVDNRYPDYLIELYERCAKHQAIVSGKVNYIVGGGFEYKDKFISIPDKAILDEFIRMVNNDGWVEQAAQSLEIFNGIFFEVIWTKSKRDFDVNILPFNKMRTNEDETMFYYSKDWKPSINQIADPEKTGYKEFKPFDPKNPGGTQVYYFKILSPCISGVNVYPKPEYLGTTAAIETDIEISNWHLTNVKTGFAAGTMINFNNGQPTEEAQESIERQIKKKVTGTDRAGALIITFNDGKDRAPEIINMTPSDLDKQFIELTKRINQEIYTGHKISSPILFGVATEGALGQRNEMIDADELFQNRYISIRQRIIENIVNMFASLKGIKNDLVIKRVESLKRAIPEAAYMKVYDSLGIPELAEELGIQLPAMKLSLKEEKKGANIDNFLKYGRKREDFVIIKSKQFGFTSYDDLVISEYEFKNELKGNERAIIDLLTKDNLMPSSEIAKTLRIEEAKVNTIIESLIERGFIDAKTKKVAGDKLPLLIPTTVAKGIVDKEGAKTLNIEVLYSYEWRTGFGASNAGTRREFCAQLQNADLLYTRQEIDKISLEEKYNVWEMKGGWYTKPGTNAHLPYCRHIWQQNVVKRK